MSGILRGWILALTGAAAFCAIALALCPEGRARSVLKLACGCVMLTALLSPLAGIDVTDIARAAARFREAADAVASGAGEAARELERKVIERECEAYISDRADALSTPLAGCRVEARWSGEGYWYPWSCALAGPHSGRLAEAIEAELGIPAERQSWEAEQ